MGQCLSVQLVNPLRRAVGRDYNQGDMSIVSLCHGRSQIKKSRTRRDANRHGLEVARQRQAQGIEARRTLVGDGMALYLVRLVKVVHDGRITASRAHHRMLDAMSKQKRCQYVYIFFIAIHLLIVSSLASVSFHSCSSMLSLSSPPPAYRRQRLPVICMQRNET